MPADAPKLNAGEDAPSPSDVPARSAVRSPRSKAGPPTVQEVLSQLKCPSGHAVTAQMVFCSACGSRIAVGPRMCSNGHEVPPEHKFCSQCGVSMAPAVAVDVMSGVRAERPRPEAELTEVERAELKKQHARALELGRTLGIRPEDWCDPGTGEYLFHVLDDGFTAFGQVWYRGQEIKIGPGSPRWPEAERLLAMDTDAQYRQWGHEVFCRGPWPGAHSYTAAVGKFQKLKRVDGQGEVSGPSEEELARADAAEQARAGRVPAPLQL